MKRQSVLFFCLLMPMILQSCAPSPYRPPTPYQRQPAVEHEQGNTLPGTTKPAGTPINPLVQDIHRQANQQIQSGRLDAAAQTLERGLRIAPKEASLWSELALVRLQQRRYGQAQSLAAKSINLAGGDRGLIRRNQRIIEEAQKARE